MDAHDLDGFTEVLADDVVFRAPGGMGGEGKSACAEFYGSWSRRLPRRARLVSRCGRAVPPRRSG